MAKAPLESKDAHAKRSVTTGSQICAVLDLRKRQTIHLPFAANRASAQIAGWGVRFLLTPSGGSAARASQAKFLAATGDAPFGGYEFPDDIALRAEEQFAGAMFRLLRGPLPAEEAWSDDRYTIKLLVTDDCDTARHWIESHFSTQEQQQVEHSGLDPREPEPLHEPIADSTQSRLGRLDALLESIPTGLSVDQLVEEFKQLERDYRLALAKMLQPLLNKELSARPQETYSEKQALATWVNRRLKEIGLAIKCPKTGKPAIVLADVKHGGSDVSRFRIEIRDDAGKKVRTFTSRALPELNLMEDEPRREPLVKWSEKVRRSKTDRSIE
jgi:hypothetical protein